jgi:signal transduction histidine kinase
MMLLPFASIAAGFIDIEHLKKELSQTSGQEKLNVLQDIVAFYYETSYDEAYIYLTEYLTLAEENNSLIHQAKAHYYYSAIAFNQIEYNKALSHTRKAIKLYEALDDSLNICQQNLTLSRSYILLRQPDSAMRSINIALNYFIKHNLHFQLQNAKIQLGKAYHISDQYHQSCTILQEVVDETRNLKQYRVLAWALYWLGSTNSKLGNFKEAIANFTESAEINDRVGNVKSKLGSMQELGDMYLKIGEFANAYQLYFDCFQQKDAVRGYRGELQFTAEYHINLGKIYQNTQRYIEAIDQYDTAMRMIDRFDFSPTRGIIHTLIGQTCLGMNEPILALHHFEQSYRFYQETSSRYYTAMSQNYIAEVYMNLCQYDSAVFYLQKAKLTNLEIHNKYGEALNRKNLAMCYDRQNKYTQAMNELDEAMTYVTESGVDNLILEYYSNYIMLCSHADDCHQTNAYFEKFLPLSYKISNQHKNNLTELLLQTYTNELDAKTALLKQTIELQNLETTHGNLQFQRLFLFTLVILLSLLVIGLLYYFKHKTAKKLQSLVDKRTRIIRENEQKLINMGKAKDKMYSIIAHDLKSPFNSLIGFSNLLHENYDDFSEREKKQIIHLIHQATEDFFALLENLLEWARSGSDGIKNKPVQNDLNLIIQHTMQLQERNAREKNITLCNHVPKNTFVFADENMLHSILRNLTSNAIKFTNAGGSVSFLSQSNETVVTCTVQDTGTGISPEDIENLFSADVKIRKKGTANENGTGLGLMLVKEFVEKNNGKLTIESQPGLGSAFSFELPVNGYTAGHSEDLN